MRKKEGRKEEVGKPENRSKPKEGKGAMAIWESTTRLPVSRKIGEHAVTDNPVKSQENLVI